MNSFRSLAFCTFVLLSSTAFVVAQSPGGPAPVTREVGGHPERIRITTKPNGQIELYDGNDRTVYATDATSSDRRLTKQANGDLAYENEHRDRIIVHANGDVTTIMPGIAVWIRTGTAADGKRYTKAASLPRMTIKDHIVEGVWERLDPDSNEWRKRLTLGQVAQAGFKGEIELIDSASGTYQITHDAARFRGTFRRDGYSKSEFLDENNKAVIRSVETFADRRQIERRILDEKALTQLGLAGKMAAAIIFTDIYSRKSELIEELGPSGWQVIRYVRESATWTRRGDNKWLSEDGKSFVFGDIRRLGPDTVRFHWFDNKQIFTFRGDGTWSKELLRQQSVLTDDGRIESVDRPEFVLDWHGRGRITARQWPSGRTYATDAQDERDRLTHDSKTGALTLIDDRQKITIKSNGSRIYVDNKGTGGTLVTDEGGRLYEQIPQGATQPVTEYRYRLEDDGRIVLREFQDRSGLWKMIPLTGDEQLWELRSGTGGRVSMDADRVFISGQNSFVIERGNQRTIRKIDGTEITQTTASAAGGLTRAETKVGVRGKGEAFTLTTSTDRDGRIVKQELTSRSGRFIREGSAREVQTISWPEFDEAGQSKSDTLWFGDVAVDSEGTLIKRSYETEPDPNSSGKLRAKLQRDSAGNPIPNAKGVIVPIVSDTVYIYTNGESERHFAHGGAVRRDKEGNVTWIRSARGDFTRFDYRSEGDKDISDIHTDGRRWTYDEKNGVFLPKDGGPALRSRLSATNVALDKKRAPVMLRINLVTKAITYEYLDGTIDRKLDDGSQTITNADGALRLFRARPGWELRLAYGKNGSLLRADGFLVEGWPKFTVADIDYKPSRENPLPSDGAITSARMVLRGWGDEKFVSAFYGRGRRINLWPDGTQEIYDRPTGSNVIRATTAGAFRIVRKGYLEPHERPEPGRLDVAKAIAPVTGAGFDKLIAYVDAEDRRIERFADGSLRIRDSQGRLVQTKDVNGNTLIFSYAGSETDPTRVKGPAFELVREPGAAGATRTSFDRAGQAVERRKIKRFHADANGNVVIEHAEDDERYLDYIDTRQGTRTEIARDCTTTEFDARNRLVKVRDAWHGLSHLFYKDDDAVPYRIASEGTWERVGDRAAGPSDVYQWKDAKSGKTVDRAAFTKDGRYAFRTATAERTQGPQASVEFLHGGKGVSRLTKSVTRRDGGTSTVTIARQPNGTWKDSRGKVYDTAWGGERTGRLLLAADNGKVIRSIVSDGSESEIRYDDRFQLHSRVEWNALGEAMLVENSQAVVTRFLRENTGEIEGIMQGEYLAVREKGATKKVLISGDRNAPVLASVTVDDGGNQIWSSENQVTRIVRTDGTVEIERSLGGRTIRTTLSADGSQQRHLFRPGNGLREVVSYANGQVEIVFRNGERWRQESYSDVIHHLDANGDAIKERDGHPRTSRGALAVTGNGSTTLMDHATRNVTVLFADGRTARLDYVQGTGWIDAASGRVCPSLQELYDRLSEIGAASPGRPDNAYTMEGVNFMSDVLLFRGLDRLRREVRR